MSMQASAQFTGAIPEHYEAGLGPILFDASARDIAARAAALRPVAVLELAAGTGIATRALRDALPATTLTATDLNAPMLAIAARKFGADDAVTIQPADATALPFPDAAFDLLVCQFGVMFFPDKVAAFREARRVLRPGGHYLFNAWAAMAANPFSEIMDALGAAQFPDNPPKFYRLPFSYSDPATAEADALAGGFVKVTCDRRRFMQRVTDWPRFAQGLVRGNPLIAEIEAHGPGAADAFLAKTVTALRDRFGAEPAEMPLEALVFGAQA